MLICGMRLSGFVVHLNLKLVVGTSRAIDDGGVQQQWNAEGARAIARI